MIVCSSGAGGGGSGGTAPRLPFDSDRNEVPWWGGKPLVPLPRPPWDVECFLALAVQGGEGLHDAGRGMRWTGRPGIWVLFSVCNACLPAAYLLPNSLPP